MKFVIDTHALVWYLQDSPLLSKNAKELFESTDLPRSIVIPTIVLAELLHISRKVVLPYSFEKTLDRLTSDDRFEMAPLTIEILQEAIPLTQFEMHDALIIATALDLNIPLMTCDGEIIESKIVKLLPI